MVAVEQLAGFALLDRLSDAHRVMIAEAAQPVDIAAGNRLFDEGEPALGCWLIRAGEVALATSVPGRGLTVVQTLGPGDLLGWSWLVPPRRWHFAATAQTPVTAWRLDTDRLRALAEDDPGLGYPLALGLFEILLTRLQDTRARLLDLYRSPRER
ncbi:MAG: cyclic nucleotide-binding domain-containing protein [Actinomycetota bacterium]|nr:cyclic nucleotide-binding domain-containing protein [Actinomycetota bacterium]